MLALRRLSPLLLLAAALVALAVFFTPGAQPAQAQTTTVWSATLTVKNIGGGNGHGCLSQSGVPSLQCSTAATLSDDDFTHDGVDYAVVTIVSNPGTLDVTLDKAVPQSLRAGTLNVGNRAYELSAATFSNSDKTISWAGSATDIPQLTLNADVSLSLTAPSTTPPPGTLSGLTVEGYSNGTWNNVSSLIMPPMTPTFDAATKSYTVGLETDYTRVRVTATWTDTDIKSVSMGKFKPGDGQTGTDDGEGTNLGSEDTSSPATAIFPLDKGQNGITVRPVPTDSSGKKTLGDYSIVVNRSFGSSNANLTTLTGTPCTDMTTCSGSLTLSPSFASATRFYTARVVGDEVSDSNTVTHVKLTPTVEDSTATVKAGRRGDTLTSVASGADSGAIAMETATLTNADGTTLEVTDVTEFVVEVTAQNGNVKRYTIVVTPQVGGL